jgi:mgtE-like transporter
LEFPDFMNDSRKGARDRLRPVFERVGLAIRGVVGVPARAVKGTGRRVADPAKQVVDYWSSERRTMSQGFIAVTIASLTSLLAGLVLVGMGNRIEVIEGLFVLIPVSIGMRGNIFGALAARLGTAILSGLFEVSRDKAGILYQNVYASILLTIGTSVTMGLLAKAMAGLLGVDTVSVWDFIVISLVGGLLSSVVVLAVTISLSIRSFRKNWDLDAVGAPLITAIGDVVTLPCLFLASFLAQIDVVTPVVGAAALVAGVFALYKGWTTAMTVAQRIVREAFPVLSIAIILDVLAGTVIQPRMDEVFTPLAAFLIIIPGFLENTGALGSILAARLGSKLHLGAVSPTATPGPVALLDGTIVLALGLLVYTLTAVATLGIATATGAAYPGAWTFLGVVMVGGIMATVIAAVIGYYAAVVTYRFGLNPDTHTIPIVTSGMDLLGVTCLVTALVLFGVA